MPIPQFLSVLVSIHINCFIKRDLTNCDGPGGLCKFIEDGCLPETGAESRSKIMHWEYAKLPKNIKTNLEMYDYELGKWLKAFSRFCPLEGIADMSLVDVTDKKNPFIVHDGIMEEKVKVFNWVLSKEITNQFCSDSSECANDRDWTKKCEQQLVRDMGRCRNKHQILDHAVNGLSSLLRACREKNPDRHKKHREMFWRGLNQREKVGNVPEDEEEEI